MKSLKEQLVNESQSNKLWVLNNGLVIPVNNALLKYDDENYISETKLLQLLPAKGLFNKAFNDAINDFKGSLEIVWCGTYEEYVNSFKQ